MIWFSELCILYLSPCFSCTRVGFLLPTNTKNIYEDPHFVSVLGTRWKICGYLWESSFSLKYCDPTRFVVKIFICCCFVFFVVCFLLCKTPDQCQGWLYIVTGHLYLFRGIQVTDIISSCYSDEKPGLCLPGLRPDCVSPGLTIASYYALCSDFLLMEGI